MINLLIASKNLLNIKNLINHISQYIPEIRISYIARNGQGILKAINKYHFDIILLEDNIKYFDIFDIIQFISLNKQNQYNKSIILLSNNSILIKNLKKHKLIFDAILKTKDFSNIIITLKKYIQTKNTISSEAYVKTKIINELQNIGYNLSHNGTHYITESILLISEFNYDSENLTKNVYPKVCQIFNKELNNVKTNIFTATDAACKNLDKQTIEKYLKISGDTKPTAKMIINYIIQKL